MSGSINAQDKSVQDAPIYQAPSKNEIKEYVAENCGYAIAFPGVPNVGNFPEGCSSIFLQRNDSRYAFRRIWFTPEDFTKKTREQIWEDVRNTHKFKNFRLSNEKALQFNGIEGKEFRYSDGKACRKVRAYFGEVLFYEMYIDLANCEALKSTSPELARSFDLEAERYFSSFRLLGK